MLVAAAAGTIAIAARNMRSVSGLNSVDSLSARVKADCSVSEIVSALVPSEISAKATMATAMARIHSSRRPVGYHSRLGAVAASFAAFALASGRASRARWQSQAD